MGAYAALEHTNPRTPSRERRARAQLLQANISTLSPDALRSFCHDLDVMIARIGEQRRQLEAGVGNLAVGDESRKIKRTGQPLKSALRTLTASKSTQTSPSLKYR
eukprot:831685_1